MGQIVLNANELADILYEAYDANKQPVSKVRISAFLEKNYAYEIQHALTEKKNTDLDEDLAGYKVSSVKNTRTVQVGNSSVWCFDYSRFIQWNN